MTEQMDLIEVSPKNKKAILKIAGEYKEVQRQRIRFLNEEKDRKQKLLGLIREAKLQPNEEGIIEFRIDGVKIKVTPRDELVQVKEEAEDDGE